jgi:hypothetical protein
VDHETVVDVETIKEDEVISSVSKKKAKATKKVAKKKTTKKVTKKTTKKVTKKKVTKKVAKKVTDDVGEKLEAVTDHTIQPQDTTQEMPLAKNAIKFNSNSVDSENLLKIKVSKTLKWKLKEKAEEEGVSLEDFISELLGEGLVLRAWEIAEGKAAVTGNANPQQGNNKNKSYQNKGGHKQQNNFKRGNKRSGSSNNKRNNYNRIMDDNANFLEYVRNQENRNR